MGLKISWKAGHVIKTVESKFDEPDVKLLPRLMGIDQFKHFFEKPKDGFSTATIHALLSRKKESSHNQELRFLINGKTYRFGEMEFALITGLYFTDPEPRAIGDANLPQEGLAKNYFNNSDTIKFKKLQEIFLRCREKEDIFKLGLCYFVQGQLLSSEGTSKLHPGILTMVEDIEYFCDYAWGRESLNMTMASFLNADVTKKIYSVHGHAISLQFWAYEAISGYAKKFGHQLSPKKFPRMLKWEGRKNFKLEEIENFLEEKHFVKTFLPLDGDVAEEVAFVKKIKFSIQTVKQYDLDESQIFRVEDEAAEQAAKEAAEQDAKDAVELAQIANAKGFFKDEENLECNHASTLYYVSPNFQADEYDKWSMDHDDNQHDSRSKDQYADVTSVLIFHTFNLYSIQCNNDMFTIFLLLILDTLILLATGSKAYEVDSRSKDHDDKDLALQSNSIDVPEPKASEDVSRSKDHDDINLALQSNSIDVPESEIPLETRPKRKRKATNQKLEPQQLRRSARFAKMQPDLPHLSSLQLDLFLFGVVHFFFYRITRHYFLGFLYYFSPTFKEFD